VLDWVGFLVTQGDDCQAVVGSDDNEAVVGSERQGKGGAVARAIWTGSLSFGLVNVPVGVYSATDDKTVHFNQLQRDTADRVRMKRVNERTGEEVPYDEIVKGYDIGGGKFVIIDSEELEAVEPGRSRNIEITDFVNLSDIDPVFYKSTYYLAPQGRDAQRAYALLRQAMLEQQKVGVATFVLRNKQHLVAVRPDNKVLALETMYFADEVRDPLSELDTLPGDDVTFRDREIDTAKLLIDSMTADWEPEQYRDTYRDAVEELIERKSRGEVVAHERPEEPAAPVVDLMEALRASVEAARDQRRSAGGGAEAPARAATSAKAAVKRTKAGGGAKAGASRAAEAKKPADEDEGQSEAPAPAQSSRRRKAS
jgi:DNA end-binding protein Ku